VPICFFRLGLTEQTPAIKSIEEAAWAKLADAKSGPIEPSLALTDALHRRWLMLLGSLSDVAWNRVSRKLCYSHRNTFAESAVQTTKTKASAATSPTCADHASPLQIPSSSDTV
jgi:hypothetical protein